MGMYVCIYNTSVYVHLPLIFPTLHVIQISLCLNLSPVYNQMKPSTTLPEHVLFYPAFFPYGFYLGFFPGGSSGTSLTVVDIIIHTIVRTTCIITHESHMYFQLSSHQ